VGEVVGEVGEFVLQGEGGVVAEDDDDGGEIGGEGGLGGALEEGLVLEVEELLGVRGASGGHAGGVAGGEEDAGDVGWVWV
jgi:hypothetical protein